MSGGGGGEKTEKPTAKRLKEARREGRVAKSPEVASWAALLAATVVLPLVVRNATGVARDLLVRSRDQVAHPDPLQLPALLGGGLLHGLLAVLPVVAVVLVTALLGHAAQGGFHLATKALKPKATRLNPVAGLKRMLGAQGLTEAVKALVKAVLIGLVAWHAVSGLFTDLARQGTGPLAVSLGGAASAAVGLLRAVAVAGLLVGVVDIALVRRRTGKGLRMTKQEVKEEARQSEGDPHLKGQLRARAAAISRNRMMAAVASADVVLANPTHVAVALRYEPGRGAPRVVASGKGAVALAIRRRAEEHRVPVVVDVPLARAVHAACEVGQEIPAALFTAVARVLAFVLGLRRRGSAAGTHRVPGAPLLPAATAAPPTTPAAGRARRTRRPSAA